MSYYQRYAMHNTPLAQQEMLRLRAEVAYLRMLLENPELRENTPPTTPEPPPSPPPRSLLYRLTHMG